MTCTSGLEEVSGTEAFCVIKQCSYLLVSYLPCLMKANQRMSFTETPVFPLHSSCLLSVDSMEDSEIFSEVLGHLLYEVPKRYDPILRRIISAMILTVNNLLIINFSMTNCCGYGQLTVQFCIWIRSSTVFKLEMRMQALRIWLQSKPKVPFPGYTSVMRMTWMVIFCMLLFEWHKSSSHSWVL